MLKPNGWHKWGPFGYRPRAAHHAVLGIAVGLGQRGVLLSFWPPSLDVYSDGASIYVVATVARRCIGVGLPHKPPTASPELAYQVRRRQAAKETT